MYDREAKLLKAIYGQDFDVDKHRLERRKKSKIRDCDIIIKIRDNGESFSVDYAGECETSVERARRLSVLSSVFGAEIGHNVADWDDPLKNAFYFVDAWVPHMKKCAQSAIEQTLSEGKDDT